MCLLFAFMSGYFFLILKKENLLEKMNEKENLLEKMNSFFFVLQLLNEKKMTGIILLLVAFS